MPQTLDNLTYTWNNSGTTFTGIKYNVTDTASAAGSLLMDLQVGGASKFKVDKNGAATLANINANGVIAGQDGNGKKQLVASGSITLTTAEASPSFYALFNASDFSLSLKSTGYIGFTTSYFSIDASSPRIYYDGAHTLAQRNGVNAQTFNIYSNYIDASNYQRGFLRWKTNVLEIGSEAEGAGGYKQSMKFYAGTYSGGYGSGFDFTIQDNNGAATKTLGIRGTTLSGTILFNLNASATCSLNAGYWSHTTAFGIAPTPGSAGPDVGIGRSAASVLSVLGGASLNAGAAMELTEITAPAAPATTKARLYVDNSGGKSRLMVLFATGAAIQLAIQV